MHDDLEYLKRQLSQTDHLKATLNPKWIQRVRDATDQMGLELTFADQSYHLFRILRDDKRMVKRLDKAIGRVKICAEKNSRLKHFNETRKKLKSNEANQIQAAIFEILVLAQLIKLSVKENCAIELYPRVSNGGGNIEGRIRIDSRWCNVEAKALGYSHHDVGMKEGGPRIGSHSVESMERQIYDALEDKVEQLSHTPVGEPNIVLLALGYNADSHSSSWAIKDFLKSQDGRQLSAVLRWGSFLLNRPPKLFINVMNSCRRRLTATEKRFFEGMQFD